MKTHSILLPITEKNRLADVAIAAVAKLILAGNALQMFEDGFRALSLLHKGAETKFILFHLTATDDCPDDVWKAQFTMLNESHAKFKHFLNGPQ